MSQLRFILDGTEVANPIGYETFASRLFRDEDIKGLFISYPQDLTFTQDGYQYIVDKFDNEGYCTELTLDVEVECDGIFSLAWQGIIYLRTLELNRRDCTAKVAVQDNTYSARVFNNKSIPVPVESPLSKNEKDIVKCPRVELKFWNTINDTPVYESGAGEAGFTNNGTRAGFDIMECIRHIVRFITDDEVQVKSDWYDNLPVNNMFALVSGKELRLGQNYTTKQHFENSFEDLYQWLQRSYNLFMTFEVNEQGKFLRIEDRAFYETVDPVVEFDDVDNVIESIKEIELYSKVRFGGQATIDDEDDSNGDFPVFDLVGFKSEEYMLSGLCNVDNELDLTTKYITDHNIIYDVLNNPDPEFTEYDDEIFIVQFSRITDPKLTIADPILLNYTGNANKYVYNGQVVNSRIIERYRLHGDLAKYFDGDNKARAYTLTNSTYATIDVVGGEVEPLLFEDDWDIGYDPANNYGNGTTQGNYINQIDCLYTTPLTGMYSWTMRLDTKSVVNGLLSHIDPSLYGNPFKYKIYYGVRRYSGATLRDTQEQKIIFNLTDIDGNEVYDNDGNPIKTDNLVWYHQVSTLPVPIGSRERYFTTQKGGNIYCESGDTLVPFFRYEQDGNDGDFFTIRAGSWFNITELLTAGGVFQAGEADDYFVSLLTFEKEITRNEINALLTNARKSIRINGRLAYIDDVALRHYDTFGEFQLITNRANR